MQMMRGVLILHEYLSKHPKDCQLFDPLLPVLHAAQPSSLAGGVLETRGVRPHLEVYRI